MKKNLFILVFIFFIMNLKAQFTENIYPVYKGSDLGLTYIKANAVFRIWSPRAEQARLLLYKDGDKTEAFESLDMEKSGSGTWIKKIKAGFAGSFYTFQIKINGRWSNEVIDPYARAVGINGKRGMLLDLARTNPAGWANDKSPSFSKQNKPTDAIIYELHIRDASINSNSGIQNKGKYLGLAETGTKTKEGLATGLDHLKEMGVTHIHLLPFFDYNSLDESQQANTQYNWGYDPLNYNVPEGSYASNASDGATRIRELKQLILQFHRNGLRVVMDAVYNHTGLTEESNFNQLVPGYYYRHKKDGTFSNATGCNNETASERPMMRKFMLESVLFWVKEYHIDGFRFDLMGVHDIETMNLISDELHKIKPDILLYGEGWTAGDCPLPDSARALKMNVSKLHHIAVFSDDIRDGIKGSVFDINDRGFASGKAGMEESIKFGIVAACDHPQVNYKKVNYSKSPYANSPENVITYCECHDNNTLWDKLSLSCKDITEADRKKMHQLALTIVLTSQGIPFLHAGTEFQRSKKGVENSYNSGDSINAIDWDLKKEYLYLTKYIEKLIGIRKAHPAFRLPTSSLVKRLIHFDDNAQAGTAVYMINGSSVGDGWKKIWVAFNGSREDKQINLPKGEWKMGIAMEQMASLHSGMVEVNKYSAVILYQD